MASAVCGRASIRRRRWTPPPPEIPSTGYFVACQFWRRGVRRRSVWIWRPVRRPLPCHGPAPLRLSPPWTRCSAAPSGEGSKIAYGKRRPEVSGAVRFAGGEYRAFAADSPLVPISTKRGGISDGNTSSLCAETASPHRAAAPMMPASLPSFAAAMVGMAPSR